MDQIEYSVRERITTVYDIVEFRKDDGGSCSMRTVGSMYSQSMGNSICGLLTAQLAPERRYSVSSDPESKAGFDKLLHATRNMGAKPDELKPEVDLG